MSATLDAALAYAARGWRVHRLYHLIRDRAGVVTGCACEGRTGHTGPDGAWVSEPNGCADPASKAWGKHPRGAWHKLTTTDPAAIRALWGKAPRAQVGIACGPESDLWVLDIDGDGGRAQLAALEAQHGALPPTWTVATGSGGEQRYFRWPLCGRKPANRAKMIKSGAAAVIGEGLDARGAGGQVVAPPSENRNGPYRVALDAPLAYAPGWLLDLVCPPPPKPRPAAPPPEVGVTGEGLEKRLRGLLAYVCARVAETTAGGQDALNKAAWTIGRHHAAHPGILSDAEIVAALESAAEACGLPMSGARATIRSTLAKAAGEPVPLADRERPEAPPKAARQRPQEARHAPQPPDPAPDSPRADPGQQGAAQAAGEAPEQDAPPPQIEGLPEGWVTPPGYTLGPSGVWHEKGEGEKRQLVKIAGRPIWIAARLTDAETDLIYLRIAWPGGSATMAREAALDQHKILALAGKDAPVASTSASALIRWLAAAEEANRETVPHLRTVGRLGWVAGADGAPIWQGPDGPLDLRAEQGERQTAAAMRPRGEWADWTALADRVHAASPVALATLAASVGSALLARVGPLAAPFVVDLSGGSGKGKTVAMRWAASAWAEPTDAAAWIKPWSSSPPNIESCAAFLQNVPLFLDDTRKLNLKRRAELGGSVYQWASGQGAGRGRIDGAREIRTWRSVIFSTGEVPLPAVFGQDIGLRMRMVRIEDDPFREGEPLVFEIEDVRTWGHAGPRVTAWALQIGDDELRARWTTAREWLARDLGGAGGGANWAARAAGYGATTWLGLIALSEIGVPMGGQTEQGMAAALLRWLRAGIESADVAGDAWDRCCGWLASQSGRITASSHTDRPDPPGGWLGRVGSVAVERDTGTESVSVVCVLPAELEAVLARWGFDPNDILPAWVKRGWLIEGDRRARATKWRGKPVRLYHLQIEGWGVEGGIEAEEQAHASWR